MTEKETVTMTAPDQFGGEAMLSLSDQIPCTRYEGPDADNNVRVRQTLAYACALLEKDEDARQMLRCIASLHDYKGELTVDCCDKLSKQHEECLRKAWADWGNEPLITFSCSTWRAHGCSECREAFAESAPFVTHETDSSIGGPWCIECAVNKYGFGGPDPNHDFIIHQ
jgi:hypothetical protein